MQPEEQGKGMPETGEKGGCERAYPPAAAAVVAPGHGAEADPALTRLGVRVLEPGPLRVQGPWHYQPVLVTGPHLVPPKELLVACAHHHY